MNLIFIIRHRPTRRSEQQQPCEEVFHWPLMIKVVAWMDGMVPPGCL